MRRYLTLVSFVAVGLALAVAPALAGGSKRSSIDLLLLAPALSSSTAAAGPQFGDQVSFNVTTDAARPQVDARCYQNGVLVYEEWHGFFDGALGGRTFTLGPTRSWLSGSADCEARLVEWLSNGKQRTLASMRFHVGA